MQIEDSFEFGLIGLGVMGRNFILNVAENGFSALGYDLDSDKVEALIKEGSGLGKIGATSNLKSFVHGLSSPRKIMLLVPAGSSVDDVITGLLPELKAGDILVDGGNSHFEDTDRREAQLRELGIHFFINMSIGKWKNDHREFEALGLMYCHYPNGI